MATFTKNVEPITVTTAGGPATDPDWTYTDKAGHKHYAYPEEPGKPRWPTLKNVVDRTYWCEECRDEHEESHYECSICGEVIEPGMIHKGPETKTLQGPTTLLINDIPVSQEVWDEAIEIARSVEHEADERIDALVEAHMQT